MTALEGHPVRLRTCPKQTQNDANMRGLESLLAVIDEYLKEIMPGLSASEKTMMKTKMTNWVQRI